MKKLTNFCLVLDMDETLVNSVVSEDGLYPLDKKKKYEKYSKKYIYNFSYTYFEDDGQLSLYKFLGTKRPFLDEFLDFCSMYFNKIMIWSAGEDKYVKNVCARIFKGKNEPIIWTRKKCYTENKNKPLKFIYEDEYLSNFFNEKNTLIIDDKLETIMAEDKNNAIIIPQFTQDITSNLFLNKDKCLLQLINWFQNYEFFNCKDVRKLDKKNIFE